MDPTVQIDDILELVCRGHHTISNAVIINVFHYRVTNTASPPTNTLSEFVTAARQAYEVELVPELSDTYVCDRVEGKVVSGSVVIGGVPRWTYVGGIVQLSTAAGTKAGDYLPQHVTVSCHWRTGWLGRYWRGGTRFSPIAESDQDAADQNKLDAAAKAAWQAACNSFRAPLTFGLLSTARLGVASLGYYHDVLGDTGPVANAFAEYTSNEINNYFRTQNSRQAPHVP